MISRWRKKVIFYSTVGVVLFFSIHGCYTTFSHPPVPDSKWGQVRMGDDCAECHEQSLHNQPVLPASAEGDYSWQFYSATPWWQDEKSMPAGNIAEPPETTGPRSFGNTPSYDAPSTVPVNGPAVQTLGKSSADEKKSSEASDSADDRRSVERRTDTTSTPEKSSDKADSSRTRNRRK
jgi:hypothetical protein